MRNYDDYNAADFIRNDFFVEWVLHPTPEADEFWEHWLKLHPDKKKEVLLARKLMLALDFKKTPVEQIPAEAILNRIRSSIRDELRQSATPSIKAPRPRWWVAAAAAVFAVIGAGLVLYLNTRSQVYTSVQTTFDERRQVILPDESIVLLNANTKLKYKTTWSPDAPREVWLHGEAFFTVTKSDHPDNLKFLVHTENLNVEVLGTTFNVVNRRGKTQVVLNTGKVRLTSSDTREKAITMQPGELAELSQGQEVFITRQVNPAVYTSWTSNQLIFQQSSLKEVIQTLEDNYGYAVENQVGEIENMTFTATIPTVDLDTVLYVLSETYGVNFRKKDKAIVISARTEIK
jgi:ferric-dicitrate binding protein FerR (iron transport regulator)